MAHSTGALVPNSCEPMQATRTRPCHRTIQRYVSLSLSPQRGAGILHTNATNATTSGRNTCYRGATPGNTFNTYRNSGAYASSRGANPGTTGTHPTSASASISCIKPGSGVDGPHANGNPLSRVPISPHAGSDSTVHDEIPEEPTHASPNARGHTSPPTVPDTMVCDAIGHDATGQLNHVHQEPDAWLQRSATFSYTAQHGGASHLQGPSKLSLALLSLLALCSAPAMAVYQHIEVMLTGACALQWWLAYGLLRQPQWVWPGPGITLFLVAVGGVLCTLPAVWAMFSWGTQVASQSLALDGVSGLGLIPAAASADLASVTALAKSLLPHLPLTYLATLFMPLALNVVTAAWGRGVYRLSVKITKDQIPASVTSACSSALKGASLAGQLAIGAFRFWVLQLWMESTLAMSAPAVLSDLAITGGATLAQSTLEKLCACCGYALRHVISAPALLMLFWSAHAVGLVVKQN
eukprot:gene12440-15640_t